MFCLHAGFLCEFAQRRNAHVFAFVDPALGHLPPVAFLVVDPPPDEYQPVSVDQHHTDAGAVAEFVHRVWRSSMTAIAERKSSRSLWPLGIAFLSVVKPWMMPGNSR